MSRKYETRGQKKKADPPAPEETKQSKKGGKSVDSSLKTSIKTGTQIFNTYHHRHDDVLLFSLFLLSSNLSTLLIT